VRIEVRFYGELERLLAGGERRRTFELPDGSRVADLLATLPMSPETILIIGLNGRLADRLAVLSDGDELQLLTAMAGGN